MSLIAAALLLATLGLAVAGRSARAAANVNGRYTPPSRHYCSVTDKQFIEVATTQLQSVNSAGSDYLHGQGKAAEVIGATHDAVSALDNTEPQDASLLTARHYLSAMFTEYGHTAWERSKNGDAAANMYKAYLLAGQADYVLRLAEPALAPLGCDVSALL